AACQRFQQHQTEGIGATGKDEHVSSGVDFGQSVAMHRSEEYGIRKFSRESPPRRAGSNDDLGAGQIELQKGFQILFYRQPPHGQENRSGQRRSLCARGQNKSASTPRGHSLTFLKPRVLSSEESVGVAASTAAPGAWKRRSQAHVISFVQDSGSGSRSARYSGKRVWKLVVNGKPLRKQIFRKVCPRGPSVAM